jgi:hypothetical protein
MKIEEVIMADIHAITPERHGKKFWTGYKGYQFALGDALCPLVLQELSKAVLSLPIGFVVQGKEFIPVAIQGLKPGKNLFVAPDGRWLTNYVPAVYRSYPFRMARTEDGEQILCVDEDSGLISDIAGKAFFNEDGTPDQSVVDIFHFFSDFEKNRSVTNSICAVLQKHNLIQPWTITVKEGDAEQNIDGLFRIDEAALQDLSAEDLLEVRNSGGLTVAYCQLLSIQHLPSLGQLAQAQEDAEKALLAQSGQTNLGFIKGADTFSFGD